MPGANGTNGRDGSPGKDGHPGANGRCLLRLREPRPLSLAYALNAQSAAAALGCAAGGRSLWALPWSVHVCRDALRLFSATESPVRAARQVHRYDETSIPTLGAHSHGGVIGAHRKRPSRSSRQRLTVVADVCVAARIAVSHGSVASGSRARVHSMRACSVCGLCVWWWLGG